MTPSSSDGGLAALEELRAAIGPRYDIKGELGRGTGGIVYLAYDLERKESVALKVLRDHLDPVGIARFRREIEIGTKLRHARIVSLLDSGSVGSRPYYVMQRILGPSLKDRLSDERQLAMKDVFAIAAQAAEALDHAHANQVVHRDIKPANILLGASGALVADFGIAQLRLVPGDSLTDSGLSIGTPQYMSPEQAAGQHTIDGRADIYGLACVVYEMIGGQPPFTGATAQAVMAQHMNEQPRSLRVVRPNISLAADAAIMKALSKVPADRFATAGEFAEALARPDSRLSGAVHRVSAVTRGWGFRIGLAAAVIVGMFAASRSERLMERVGLVPVRLDSTVIAAMIVDSTSPSGLSVSEPLASELGRWSGISAANRIRLEEALRATGRASETPSQRARRAAESVRASRYMLTNVYGTGPGAHIDIVMSDTRRDSVIAQVRLRAGVAATAAVDSLLFRSDFPRTLREERDAGTTSVAARRGYLRALAALEDGFFYRADSLLLGATRADPDFPQALLWHAVTRWWLRTPDAPWAPIVAQAERAASLRPALGMSEERLLNAMRAQASQRTDEACQLWRDRTRTAATDYFAWYSLGQCLRSDSVVVMDARSPSRWRFRSSYEESVRASERAFAMRPVLMRGLGSRALGALQLVFSTNSSRTLSGVSFSPDTQRFRAYPSWRPEGVVFVPYPTSVALAGGVPADWTLALRHQRERLYAAVRAWRAARTDELEAMEAIAFALELLGNPSSADTLRASRVLARTPIDSVRLAGSEALLRLKYSLPDDSTALLYAIRLVDSLLTAPTERPGTAANARLLGSLAALTGRAALAAHFATAGGIGEVDPALALDAPALLALSALGGPESEIRRLEARVRVDIATLPADRRPDEQNRWLARSAGLAYPGVVLRAALDSAMTGTAALARKAMARDEARLRQQLAEHRAARVSTRVPDVALEVLFAEASSLAAIGDSTAAAAWIDPALNELRTIPSGMLGQIPNAAALARAMHLRSLIARSAKDAAVARRWSTAITMLWRTADPFLRLHAEQLKNLNR